MLNNDGIILVNIFIFLNKYIGSYSFWFKKNDGRMLMGEVDEKSVQFENIY